MAGTGENGDAEEGTVIPDIMRKLLQWRGIDVAEGSLAKRVGALTFGKMSGTREYARRFYEEFINPGFEGGKQRWLVALSGRLWGVCSARMRGDP